MSKRERLPDAYHMTIAQIDGRFYPVRTMHDEQGEYTYLGFHQWASQDAYAIPPALGPRHRTGIVSFPTYQGALDFCHREADEGMALLEGDRLAAACEVYPERNAWYIAEIEAVAQTTVCIRPSLFGVDVSLWLSDETWFLYGKNIDDALVNLYERLYAHAQEKEPVPVAIS